MTQSLSGKIIIDKLAVDFEIINMFMAIFTQFPPISYVYHVELRVLVKEMKNMELPYLDQCKTIEKFGRKKYKLHQ